MAEFSRNSLKDKRKYVRPFKVMKADPDHLQNMIKQAREKEKFWRVLNQEVEEEPSNFSAE